MRAEIITSGTELLLGEITDTNTPYLAKKLAAIGINVYHHTTVGDNPTRLRQTIQHAEKRAEIIIISGGLGPTQDDITKEVLAEHLNTKLVPDEASLVKVKKRYPNEKISTGNYRQALTLAGAQVLPNDVGMAAGLLSEMNQRVYVLLPGPPNEFEQMVTNYLLPELTKLVHVDQVLHSRTLNFYGIGESVLSERIASLIEKQTNPTLAIYAKEGIIDIRLTASAGTITACDLMLDELEEEILEVLHPYFLGYDKTSLEDLLFSILEKEGQKLALLDIQADGNLVSRWREHPKSKKVFKGSLYFSHVDDAVKYYDIGSGIEKENITEKEQENWNEVLATEIQIDFQTDYGLSLMNVGGLDQEKYIVLLSLYHASGKLYTHRLDFSERTYFPPWLIRLRVNEALWKMLRSGDLPVG